MQWKLKHGKISMGSLDKFNLMEKPMKKYYHQVQDRVLDI